MYCATVRNNPNRLCSAFTTSSFRKDESNGKVWLQLHVLWSPLPMQTCRVPSEKPIVAFTLSRTSCATDSAVFTAFSAVLMADCTCVGACSATLCAPSATWLPTSEIASVPGISSRLTLCWSSSESEIYAISYPKSGDSVRRWEMMKRLSVPYRYCHDPRLFICRASAH